MRACKSITGPQITVKSARLALHTDFMINTVDGPIFGGFLEHMGRTIFEGVYDPNSMHADEDGMRSDVLEALHQLEMPIARLDRFGLAQFVNLLRTEIQ